jgi:alkaline phosphatase
MTAEYHQHLDSTPSNPTAYVKDALDKGLGIKDASDEELLALVDKPDQAQILFADMISRRSQTGWSTHGHSAADVNIYASSAKAAAPLLGNHENTEVGEFLRDYLGVDVQAVTEELKEKGTAFNTLGADGKTVSWMGRIPGDGERLDGQDHMSHYAGDFKKHKHKRGCDICDGL